MVEVKDIFIEGFASITEPLLYDFERKGINLILGNNGAGKSTVYNALTWVLYGTTIKGKIDINTWDSLKPKDYKGTHVECTLMIDEIFYTIHRYHKYKGKAIDGVKGKDRLMIYENGVLYEKDKDKRDQQAYLEKKLGMTFRLFKNAIIFGQKLSRLLKEGGQEQKKVLDELFNAYFIDKAKEKVDLDITKLNEGIKNLELTKDKLEHNIGTKKTIYDERLEAKNRFNKNQKIKKDNIKEKIENLKVRLKLGKTNKSAWDKKQKEIRELKVEIDRTEDKFTSYNEAKSHAFKLQMQMVNLEVAYKDVNNKLQGKLDEFKNIKKNCITCGQLLDAKKLILAKDKIAEQGKKYRKQTKIAQKSFDDCKIAYNKADSSETKLDKHQYHFNSLKSLLEVKKEELESIDYNPALSQELKLNITDYEASLRNIKDEVFDFNFKELLDKITNKSGKLKKLTKGISKQYSLKVDLMWASKTALSNSGLKTYIFNYMLEEVNINLEKYAEVLGFGVLFEISLETANKNLKASIFKGEQITVYENLSGGEQQLVDIAVAFAIHDVIAKENNFNILLMDEIFESLDNLNIDLVTDLILTKSSNVYVHLITHLSEFRPSNSNITQLTLGPQYNTIVL